MTTDRAIEILNPERWNRNKDEVSQACRMGMEALECPLLAFIKQEVPFRLSEVLNVEANQQTPELVAEMVKELWHRSDLMFNYDAIDSLLSDVLRKHGIETEETEGEE